MKLSNRLRLIQESEISIFESNPLVHLQNSFMYFSWQNRVIRTPYSNPSRHGRITTEKRQSEPKASFAFFRWLSSHVETDFSCCPPPSAIQEGHPFWQNLLQNVLFSFIFGTWFEIEQKIIHKIAHAKRWSIHILILLKTTDN